MIKPLQSEEDYRQLLRDSATAPVLLLKHSTACPVSAGARRAYVQFTEEEPAAGCWEVLVIEQRPLSRQIAEETGVHHQSPQVILFIDGKPVWSVTHRNITVDALRAAYSNGFPTNR